jgi:glutamate transport system substrate-binding protein
MHTRRGWLLVAGPTALLMATAACGGNDAKVSSGTGSAVATTLPAAPALPSFLPGTTMAAIQARGRLIVGTRFDLTGFGVKNPSTGAVEGFDVEVAKLIAVGIFGGTPATAVSKIEFMDSVTATREASIKDGQVDLAIAAYRITDAAKQQVDFAGPYFMAGQDLLVRSADTTIKGFSDLAGKKVCSSRATGTAVQNVRAKAPDAESIQMDTTPQCADALTEGRVDAVASVNTSLLGPLEKSTGALRLVANPSTEEPNGIGIRRGDDAFRSFINDQLEKSYAGGQWASAYATTLGKFGWRAPNPPPVDRYPAAAPAATSTSRP